MKTQIKLWSNIGHTPITKRGSSYCDLLLDIVIDCDSPESAKEKTRALIKETDHATYGHFYMPEHPNQNIRAQFVNV